MAGFSKLTDAEKEVVAVFSFCENMSQEWRDAKTWEPLQDRIDASKWCVKAIHAENLNFEATESLQKKKLIYWFANEKDGNAYYHLTPKGFKAAVKTGIIG